MRNTRITWTLVAFALLAVVGVLIPMSPAEDSDANLARAQKLMQEGNAKDAYAIFKAYVTNPKSPDKATADALPMASGCLMQLGELSQLDEFWEAVVAAHPNHWRTKVAVAQQYLSGQSVGFMISGKFERGWHRGQGKIVNADQRDRTRAMQLLVEAMPLADKDDDKAAVSQFYFQVANALLRNRGYGEAWRLQVLTDLSQLPDYDEGHGGYYPNNGAPVDAEGNPVFHKVPKSWDAAVTDGERWRWAMQAAVENQPALRGDVERQFADFLQSQFGVETLQQWGYGHFFGHADDDDTKKNTSGTYELHTLTDDETICKLATGIKRIKLPDEFNYLKLYKKMAESREAAYAGHAEGASTQVAQCYENRRQYETAADVWKKAIVRFGPGVNNWRADRLQQIVGNWGMFEHGNEQPAGSGAKFNFRFRNAKKVKFEAQKVDIEKLFADLKTYLKSDPQQLDWQKVQLDQIGYRIVQGDQAKYLGPVSATWDLELEPRPRHFDRITTVTSPLQKAGAYMVTAKIDEGNTSQAIVWVSDTVIAGKRLDQKQLYFVADAVSGKEIAGANLEFFGYKQEHLGNNRWRVHTSNFSEKTSSDGIVTPNERDLKTDYQWTIIARSGSGATARLAFIGFRHLWFGRSHDEEYNAVKTFIITDRPVYRPKQKVFFKIWVRHAKYDQPDTSDYANATFPVEIRDPEGNVVSSQTLKTDEYGGLSGEHELPNDAKLGIYHLTINHPFKPNIHISGGNTFRVEEYKKPEFEVTIDAPTEPVMLGEKITASIKAKYYFGSPVAKGKVKYKVTRTNYQQEWYPVGRWDWCYGPGYWWFCPDPVWYRGWNEWVGCSRPHPFWIYRGPSGPPEIVSEIEVDIPENGQLEVPIDTTAAKEMHANFDHQYEITAEVRDESRRVIVGQGKVLVARKPFRVFTWLNRGYFQAGDKIEASFKAQTLDNKPVEGKGELRLLKISYDTKKQPVETPVEKWPVDTNAEGLAEKTIQGVQPGQYRLSYKVKDSAGHEIEGGYLFTIVGKGVEGREFRFNPLELIPDKREYAAGEKLKLQVNAEKADATVLLFIRPANGVYLAPKVLKLKGKTVLEEIDIIKKDMPNFFVEALTVANAQVHTDVREVVVPPEKRVLNVEVIPSAKEYLPGEKAKVKIRLTDHTGENFLGSLAVSVYDKAVEYISGGSNVPDIKDFFWKWRRHHHPETMTSAGRPTHNLVAPGKPGMGFLGIFGAEVGGEDDETLYLRQEGEADRFAERSRMPMAPGMAMGGMGGGMMMKAARGPAMNALADAAGAPMEEAKATAAEPGDAGQAQPAAPLVDPKVRTNFADTAKWVATLNTNKAGEAEFEIDMPENLSAWKIRVWGMGHGTKVGSGDIEIVTRKNLVLRLQSPRFFVQKDEVVLSANVHNYLPAEKEVTVSLEVPGNILKPLGETTTKIKIPAGGEQRVDWRVKVVEEGEAVVRMKALTDIESDATELKLPSYVHGMLKTESWASTVRANKESNKISINVPKERRPDQSVLEIRYSPTLAAAMLDALPYLADYPYGCTEQTLNRFLPSVITQKTLRDLDFDLGQIREKRTNLNAQEIGDDVERAKQWKRFDRNPVFDRGELDDMVKDGLKALTEMQLSDGGWGWFSGWNEKSWPHTTAVVVRGLLIARESDVALVPGVLENGVEWLKRYQAKQLRLRKNGDLPKPPPFNHKTRIDNLDALVYMVLSEAGTDNLPEMVEYLYKDRVENLSVYGKTMFALGLQKRDIEPAKLEMLVKNIEQFLIQDGENETAYLKLPEGNFWWYWYGDEIEANALYLKLLSRRDAKGETAPRMVKYLLNNRKHATYWKSTRDTALCVEAFAEYLKGSGEQTPEMVVEIWVDGQKKKEVAIDRSNLFSFDNKLVLVGNEVTTGPHDVEIRRRGKGNVYYNAYLTNFTLEDDIKKAGLEVKVDREIYKLKPVEKKIDAQGVRGQAVKQKVEKFERIKLNNLDEIKSGDLIEVELTIQSKNDYEYLLFEDMKASGFEPVEVRSGYNGNEMGAYVEFRDNRVAFFVRQLARGKHSLSYRLRAEAPGQFSALPAKASAMYAPELKGNSDEIKIKVVD